MRIATCKCQKVEAQVEGGPIIVACCHCKDCREGAARIESLANSPALRDEHGGVPYVLYRKDRFRFTQGVEFLRKLQVDSDLKSHLDEGAKIPLDVPGFKSLAPKFIFRLLKAKVAILLRV
jgi:hypothetical protein